MDLKEIRDMEKKIREQLDFTRHSFVDRYKDKLINGLLMPDSQKVNVKREDK